MTLDSLLKILKEAEKLQVPFLIENNVIAKSNLNNGIIDSIDQKKVIPPTRINDLCNDEMFSKK